MLNARKFGSFIHVKRETTLQDVVLFDTRDTHGIVGLSICKIVYPCAIVPSGSPPGRIDLYDVGLLRQKHL